LAFGGGYGFSGYNGRQVQGGQGSNIDPNFSLPGQGQVGSDQMQKASFPWVWREPTLYIPYSADVEVTAFFRHPVNKIDGDSNGEEKTELPTIDYEEDIFFDLLQGMFLKAVGTSRRAFTVNDLPITTDASEMASEGQALEDKAMEDLAIDAKFYLAYGD
jgi:hypothetical protein